MFDIKFDKHVKLTNPRRIKRIKLPTDLFGSRPFDVGFAMFFLNGNIIVVVPKSDRDTTLFILKSATQDETNYHISRMTFVASKDTKFLAACYDPFDNGLIGPFVDKGGSVTAASRLLLSNTSEGHLSIISARRILPLPEHYKGKRLASGADEFGNVIFVHGWCIGVNKLYAYHLIPYFR